MLFFDAWLIVLVIFLSFYLRLGYWYFPQSNLIYLILISPIIAIPIFIKFGLYRSIIRFLGFKALWIIVNAVTLYSLVWGILLFIIPFEGIFPRSVIIINWFLSLLFVGGLRIVAHWILTKERGLKDRRQLGINCKKVIIYGAGDAGMQLTSALVLSHEYNPIGFIDDSKELQGNVIAGLNIYSANEISNLINKYNVDEILVAIPSASRARQLEIVSKLELFRVTVRMLPGVAELAEGKVSVGDLRIVSIQDLLGRPKVFPNKQLLDKNILGKVVLVTGAGGSIGSEICRQIVRLKPKALILYEISEFALYTIEKELSKINNYSIDVYPLLGSILNKARLLSVLKKFRVNTIYHAAAYKHVPIVELNITEGVDNNIFGTLNCVKASIEYNIETFVLISSDKAVRPTNTMGATKRVAELILQAMASKQSVTKFSMVRFGNVLDSSGSVIPLFKQQIKEGGPITVTDINISRYFMLIPEAVELVIQAGAMSSGGDVFVLDMGEPVKIKELAEKLVRLSGLKVKDKINPDGDIEIKYIGLRPGEKLFEELLLGDNVSNTDNSKIMRAEEDMIAWDKLELILEELINAVNDNDNEKLQELLKKLVPDFNPQFKIKDSLD